MSYGVFKSPDGVAFFGVYSLENGSRLATLRADAYRGGFWRAVLRNSEVLWAESAPINGMLTFSPDSRFLFATSEHIYQWDVSRL